MRPAKHLICLLAFIGLIVVVQPSTAADLYPGKGNVEVVPDDPLGYADYQYWSGLYFGSHLGYTYSDIDFVAPAGQFSTQADSLSGGILGGFNWQSGQVVLGLESDLSWLTDGDTTTYGANSVSSETNWLVSLRARAGFLYTPNILFYLTAGVAWADINFPVTGPGGGTRSKTFTGYQIGAGGETQISDNWSARLEYLYTDLDKETLTYAGGGMRFDPDFHTVRGALMFHF